MKLEILKDNKTTQARVGTIMLVPNKTGKEWVKKGFAADVPTLTQGRTGPARPRGKIEVILEEDGSSLIKNPPKQTKNGNHRQRQGQPPWPLHQHGQQLIHVSWISHQRHPLHLQRHADVTKKGSAGNRELIYSVQSATMQLKAS